MARSAATTSRWCRSRWRLQRRPWRTRRPTSAATMSSHSRSATGGMGRLPRPASGRFLFQPRQASAREDRCRAGPCGGDREGEAGRGRARSSCRRRRAEGCADQGCGRCEGRRAGAACRPEGKGAGAAAGGRRRAAARQPRRRGPERCAGQHGEPRRDQRCVPDAGDHAGRSQPLGPDRARPRRLFLGPGRRQLEHVLAAVAVAVQPLCRHQARRESGEHRCARYGQVEAVARLPAGLRARLQGRRRQVHQDRLRRRLCAERRQRMREEARRQADGFQTCDLAA